MSMTLTAPSTDLRDPNIRLGELFDADAPFVILGAVDGCVTARGLIRGLPAIAFATDPRAQAGALGAAGCELIGSAYAVAMRDLLPVVGLWQSAGARLAEGPLSLNGVGVVFSAMTRASGRIPQVSVIMGACAGGAAYGPALTDVVVMDESARLFVTGPDVIQAVSGSRPDPDELGGSLLHSRKSGVAHIRVTDRAAAMRSAADVVDVLRGGHRPSRGAYQSFAAEELLPTNPRQAYDVHPLVDSILDIPGTELHQRWAPNVVTALGRIDGRSVGVVANNPLRMGGCLDATASDKAARFVRLCDTFGLPIVVLVDVPGYLPSERQERDGIVRRGAKLVHAFASASVPRITVITRKAFGGAYIALNSRSLGATAVFAWPGAQVDVMASVAAVEITHRRELAAAIDDEARAEILNEFAAQRSAEVQGLAQAVQHGLVDRVIHPSATRDAIAEVLATTPSSRGTHTNIPL